jgi:chromosome partitioning protein
MSGEKEFHMRSIAIINQKGGVGKTTTAVNLAAALAEAGKRVCLIDMDPQAHASLHLGVAPDAQQASIYEVLVDNARLDEVRQKVADNLWLVASHLDLAAAEVELAGEVGREVLLRDKIVNDNEEFEYLLVDCPPSLGVLTLNALVGVNEVFLPLQPHFLALHGMSKLLGTIEVVAQRLNGRLRLTGIVICMDEPHTRLAIEVRHDAESFFTAVDDPECPWYGAKMFDAAIRRNIRLAEAPSFGESIFEYAPQSNGAQDYRNLAEEVIGATESSSASTAASYSRR